VIYAGIDAGSRAIKALLFDPKHERIVASGWVDQGIEQESLARQLFDRLLVETGLAPDAIGGVIATGYGRNLIHFADTTITEITCHARGVSQTAPDARTIIEIGGQDSKLIRLDGSHIVRDFAMNDRCAAGTGRFLEVVAMRLGVSLPALGDVVRQSRSPALISSMCVVFAETEIIGLLANRVPPSDIVAGVQRSIAARVAAMAGRNIEPPVYFTGGVALIPGMAAALESALSVPVAVVTAPLTTGALGAAILAGQRKSQGAP
jgi:(R)-2-hydroxyacyl-CoA dehydratese activating ATPase